MINCIEIIFDFVFPFAQCDIAYPWQVFFQDPATPMMEGIIKFHDALMFLIIFITLFVMTFLFDIQRFFSRPRLTNSPRVLVSHHTVLEIVWTLIPTILLACVAFPSFHLLYSFEEFIDPTLTVKITGYQWYWNYAMSDFENTWFQLAPNCDDVILTRKGTTYDAYMVDHVQNLFVDSPAQLRPYLEGQNPSTPGRFLFAFFRLLHTDRNLYLPVNTHIRLLVTAADVLHSWAVPSFGVKVDACPGRLSQVSLFIKRTGMFFGQCSEICGVNHGFMPIAIEAVPTVVYAGRTYNTHYGVNYLRYAVPEKFTGTTIPKEAIDPYIRTRLSAVQLGLDHAINGTPALAVTAPDLRHIKQIAPLGHFCFDELGNSVVLFKFQDAYPLPDDAGFLSEVYRDIDEEERIAFVNNLPLFERVKYEIRRYLKPIFYWY